MPPFDSSVSRGYRASSAMRRFVRKTDPVFIAIATHHPHADHVAEFEEHMHLVRETVAGADGLLSFECCRDVSTGALLGISRWESREAFVAAAPLIGANADRRQAEWTVADDELLGLESF